MRFVEDLLEAAASLETSSEKPSARKCTLSTTMHEDGTASCLRRYLAESTGPDGTVETAGGRHTAEPYKESTAVTATKGLSE